MNRDKFPIRHIEMMMGTAWVESMRDIAERKYTQEDTHETLQQYQDRIIRENYAVIRQQMEMDWEKKY